MKEISFFILFFIFGCASEEKKIESVTDLNEARGEKFQQCYHESDLYLEKKPGKMEIFYQINTEGKAFNTKVVKADFKDANLNACILGQVRTINYVPPKKVIDVYYPLNFIPGIKE